MSAQKSFEFLSVSMLCVDGFMPFFLDEQYGRESSGLRRKSLCMMEASVHG